MRVPFRPMRVSVDQKQFPTIDLLLLILSITVQFILGHLFGHIYDIRIFMSTGYLVGTGQNPYIPQDLSAVFYNLTFQNITTIGYPPSWSLVLGLIYRTIYSIIPNFLIYNLAIKIPIIAANICLAFLVAAMIRKLGADTTVARKAWIFLLFNPFLLFSSTAWGQFDSIVALLSLTSLVFLDSGKTKIAAILLALAISLKPTASPLIPIAVFFLKKNPFRQTLGYYGILFTGILFFCVVPFIIFNWDPSPILRNWNAHFTVGGGISFMAFLELIHNSYQLAGAWWLLGLLWIPALGIATYALRPGIVGFKDLLKKSTALILVFFLTLAWLSEPNIILILPLVLILTSIGELDGLTLTAIWVLPLVFSFFNTAVAQLFFPSMPDIMNKLLKLSENYLTFRLIGKLIIAIIWQYVGWRIVIRCFKKPSIALESIPPS